MAGARIDPKTLRNLMGHREIVVTLHTYSRSGLDEAKDEKSRMKEPEAEEKALTKNGGQSVVKQAMFRMV